MSYRYDNFPSGDFDRWLQHNPADDREAAPCLCGHGFESHEIQINLYDEQETTCRATRQGCPCQCDEFCPMDNEDRYEGEEE